MNNVGTAIPNKFEDATLEELGRAIDLNIRGTFFYRDPGGAEAQGLSREVGDRGITVNNIQPGPIDTDLNPAAGEWAVPQKADMALNRCAASTISRRWRRSSLVRRHPILRARA